MVPMRCPICEKPFEPEQSPAMPFCSDRCRWIDLKRWLDEEYGLTGKPPEEVDEDPAEA